MALRIQIRSVINIRNISSLKRVAKEEVSATDQNGRVIRNVLRRWWFILSLVFCNFNILHVSPSKDDIVESLLGRRDETVDLAIFRAEGVDIFKSDGRVFGIYFV